MEKKSIVVGNLSNLWNKNRYLYNLIFKYGISHMYLAEHLYPDDWAKADDVKGRAKLTGKLRNRLDGKGVLTEKEYTDLLNIMSEMTASMKTGVDKAFERYNEQRNEKINNILKGLDEETKKQLREML